MRWSSVRGVVVLTVVAALMSAWSPVASARPRDRRETVTQVYLPYDDGVGTGTVALCSLFGVDTIVSACATEGTYVQGSQSVMFPKPSWARSAFVTVRDETPGPQEAILYVTHWGTESSVHCSQGPLRAGARDAEESCAPRAAGRPARSAAGRVLQPVGGAVPHPVRVLTHDWDDHRDVLFTRRLSLAR